jgi:hypothetical protein
MDLMFSIASVKIQTAGTLDSLGSWSTATNLGKTSGGASFQQSINVYEVESDQSVDPEAKIVTKAAKTFTINLLEATPSNLALAFSGTVGIDGTSVTIDALPSGVEKAIQLTTREITGTYYTFTIPRASIIGESSFSLAKDKVATFPLNISVLTPTSGSSMKIEKNTA